MFQFSPKKNTYTYILTLNILYGNDVEKCGRLGHITDVKTDVCAVTETVGVNSALTGKIILP